MANLMQKNGTWFVRFRFLDKEFKRSLKTSEQQEALGAQRAVEWTIHRLLRGQLELPPDVDVGDFIVSGGLLQKPLQVPPILEFPTTKALIDRYLESRRHTAAPSYHESQTIHLGHLAKFLGAAVGKPCHFVTQSVLERYLLGRLKIRDPGTVKRERITITQFYNWVATRSDVPRFPMPATGLPKFKSSVDRPPFRTICEVEEVIQRGGLTEAQQSDVWECIYLTPEEIAGILALVQQRAQNPLSFLLHAIPAYSGMRRGEVMRLGWLDVDLQRGFLTARSRKQSLTKSETKRQIDLHPELKQHLLTWQDQQGRGQLVVTDSRSAEELSPGRANSLFWQPMRGTSWQLKGSRKWFKLGFHSYRHSFASNLASRGVDQRIIDEFMGHQTEAMRRRYRHLFPQAKRSAITCFSLAACPTGMPAEFKTSDESS